jgi:hypothetical protein
MKAAVLLAVLALLGAGCNDEPTKAEKAVLNAVSSSTQGRGLAELFPTEPKTESCSIKMGGPAPGRRISGSCMTSVTIGANGSSTVRFRESWDRNDFHAEPGSSRRREQSHVWTFIVTKNGRKVSGSEQGDVPPQYVP